MNSRQACRPGQLHLLQNISHRDTKAQRREVISKPVVSLLPLFITKAANFLCLFLLVLNASFVAACTPQKLKTAVLVIERAGSPTLQVGGGPLEITAEIARTDEERSRGLMYRKNVPDGEGMLFVFDRDHQVSFWMKNTLIPLSIAFISSDGRITEIRDMQPHDENSIVSSRSVRYALEVPQGWFSRVGVKPGDTVKLNF